MNKLLKNINFIIGITLCLLIFPSIVLAADTDEEFLIFGYETPERYSAHSDAVGTGWKWEATTRTLTLNNANLDKCINVPVGTTILVEGDNTVTVGDYKEAIIGDGYIITGSGNLTVDTGIVGSIIFKGTGNIQAEYIGHYRGDRGTHRIRIESGNILANEIVVNNFIGEPEKAGEIVVTGGSISANYISGHYADILILGGNIHIESERLRDYQMTFLDVNGIYTNNKLIGGHFTFLGGNLSIGNTETELAGDAALIAEFKYNPSEIGLDYNTPKNEKEEYFKDFESLIKLGNDVKVEGGYLSENIIVRDIIGGIRYSINLGGYSESYKSKDFYVRYGFAKIGHQLDTLEDNAATLTLSAPDKKPEQKLWEPTFTPRPVNVNNTVSVNANVNNQLVSSQSVIKIMLNGSSLSFNEAPYVANGTTMVPMRVIFEALKAEVNYEAASQKITATKGDTVIELVLGQKEAKKNGQTINLDVAAVTRNGNTMVPLRFVAEALNAQVDWDNATQTVIITLVE